MTTIVRIMSATVPRVPRRGAGAAACSTAEEPSSGAGGGDCGPVVVLTGPSCRVEPAGAEPGGFSACVARLPSTPGEREDDRYDAPTLPAVGTTGSWNDRQLERHRAVAGCTGRSEEANRGRRPGRGRDARRH